jgi:antitoxin component of MazEF toxin-antitoxin module
MIKTLTKHGNSYALVIDKPILDLLNIRPDTPLTISTDGKSLVVSPEGEELERSGVSEEFEQALEKVNRRYANVLRRLA